jgi:hypothetical protein
MTHGFDVALAAIAKGEAIASALWLLLGTEADRDGYALKPSPWEGPGEYQCVTFSDGRSVLVRVPSDGRALPLTKHKRAA